jgi:RNA-binding protein
MGLSVKHRQRLKAKAHVLHAVVFIGQQGLTDNIKNEIDRNLTDHELIKIRIQENDREMRRELFQTTCESVLAEPVQLIGKIGVIYRKKKE